MFLAGTAIAALIIFLKHLRSDEARAIPWRRIAGWSAWGLVAYVIIFAFGNRIASFMNAYQTAIPFKTMLAGIGIGAVIGGPLYFSGLVLLFGVAWYFARRAFPENQLPRWTGMPADYYRDAVLIGLGGIALLAGFARAIEAASTRWPTAHRAVESSFGSDFDATLPAASVLGTTLLRGLLYTGLVALVASFIAAKIKPPWLRALFFLGATIALVGNTWGTPADFVKQFLARGLLLGILIFGVALVARFNLLGYFLIAAGTALLGSAAALIKQPDAFYRANGWMVLALFIILFAWPLVSWLRLRAAVSS